MLKRFLLMTCVLCYTLAGTTQCNVDLQWEYPYSGNFSPFSIKVDKMDRPYVYVASNEEGLVILSTSGEFVAQLPMDSLTDQAKNVEQVGDLLYLATGRHALGTAPSLDIVDISEPAQPKRVGSWVGDSENGRGSGIVKVVDSIAYLGAMSQGLVLLNISQPNNIREVSRVEFDLNFPFPDPDTETFYNSRGMDIVDGIVYVCHDAGGLHIVDCRDPERPDEIGQYANPITFEPSNWPRAYNNVVVDDSLAYVAVDYCGIEVLNIGDPENIKLVDHFNPRDCPLGVWWDAPIHSNELILNKACQQLFVTSGKSELIIMDVSDPENISQCGGYGSLEDTTATWGIDMRRDSIYLSYIIIPIYIPLIHPFDAKWPGIKMLKWTDPCPVVSTENIPTPETEIRVIPNPNSGSFYLEMPDIAMSGYVQIFRTDGLLVHEQLVDPSNRYEMNTTLTAGLYIAVVQSEKTRTAATFIVHDE